MWQLSQNANLTRDNMIKRKWMGNILCSYCNEPENANHLFFRCGVARLFGECLVNVFGATPAVMFLYAW